MEIICFTKKDGLCRENLVLTCNYLKAYSLVIPFFLCPLVCEYKYALSQRNMRANQILEPLTH